MDAIRAHAKKAQLFLPSVCARNFQKMIMSALPKEGIEIAHEAGILSHIVPELEQGIDVEQNGDHIYAVWEHNLRALQHSADRGWPLQVRLAAMLHDVSKPETRGGQKKKRLDILRTRCCGRTRCARGSHAPQISERNY